MSDTNPRPSYYSQVRIDPNNDLRIWALGAPMFYSEDGGKTLRRSASGASTETTMRCGSIRRIRITCLRDRMGGFTGARLGKTWDFVNTIAIGQFYEVGLDNEKPYHICGGLQDNGSWCGPSQTLTRDGIVNEDWQVIHGGDGFYAAIDNVEPWIVYTESQDGYIDRRDLRTVSSVPSGQKRKQVNHITGSSGVRPWRSLLTITRRFITPETICSSPRTAGITGPAGRRTDDGRGPQQVADFREDAGQEHPVAARRRAGISDNHNAERIAVDAQCAVGGDR